MVLALVTMPISEAGGIFGDCFSGGCDVIWHLNQHFDQGLRSKSDSLVGPAKEAFDDSMRKLFDDRLSPMLGSINSMAAARIGQTQAAADAVIQEAQNGVDAIIDHAARAAHDSAVDLKQHIIDETFKEASDLAGEIESKVVHVIDEADCAVAGTIDKARLMVTSALSGPHLFDSCYHDLGFYVFTPRSDDYVSIYRIHQCQLEKELVSAKTVATIQDDYVRLASWAQNMRCVMRQTPIAVDTVATDIDRYTRSYLLWKEVVAP